jgi:hypothetical protein
MTEITWVNFKDYDIMTEITWVNVLKLHVYKFKYMYMCYM